MEACSGNILHTDVCLVMPPVSFGSMPSTALGILKACLNRAQISCSVDYANMVFQHAMGKKAFSGIYHGSMHGFLGEYIFNEAAGIENPYSMDDFIHYQLGDADNVTDHLYLRDLLRHSIRIANEETLKTADRILQRDPKIVGCTAVFEQRNAALAILKEIKKRRPDIITLMGGFCCFDYGGIAMLEQFPFLDYVFCGESDDIFADCCRQMIDGTLRDLPYGLLKQGGPFPGDPPHRVVRDMDLIPMPDYSDYSEMLFSWFGFAQFQMFNHRSSMQLTLETSRGCWWGEKHSCLFCGLNGQAKCHRVKSPEKVLAEIRRLVELTGNSHICFTDCILPLEWFRDLFPKLKADPNEYHFTAEVKANLSREQIVAMKEAGFDNFQPGIESLSDHVLELMHKGVTGIQNIALLKYARENGMTVLWNILTGTVGETAEDYRVQTEMLPLLEHLQPPINFLEVIFMRDSVYYDCQEKYGLKLVPDPVFRFISPDDASYVERIAFHFIDENKTADPAVVLETGRLKNAVEKWQRNWKKGDLFTRLDAWDDGETLYITDNRSVSGERNLRVDGLRRRICLAADHPVSQDTLIQSLSSGGEIPSEAEIRAAVNRLIEQKLLLHYSGKYFFLALSVSRERAFELSYREFFTQMAVNRNIRVCVKTAEGNGPAEKTARAGEMNGYLFDPETVEVTDLIPDRNESDMTD